MDRMICCNNCIHSYKNDLNVLSLSCAKSENCLVTTKETRGIRLSRMINEKEWYLVLSLSYRYFEPKNTDIMNEFKSEDFEI